MGCARPENAEQRQGKSGPSGRLSELHPGQDIVHLLGQFEVKLANTARLVRGQIDGHAAVNIAPFRVVVHLLGQDSRLGHEAQGLHEILEF